jgi:hypothetical protein
MRHFVLPSWIVSVLARFDKLGPNQSDDTTTMRIDIGFSAIVALIAFLGPIVFRREALDLALKVSFWTAVLWLFTLVFVLVRYRKKGLWILLSAPFALYWTYVLVMLGIYGE